MCDFWLASCLLTCSHFGNLIITIGTALAITGPTLGVRFPRKSAAVLVPLTFGIIPIGSFIYYEVRFPKVPEIPQYYG